MCAICTCGARARALNETWLYDRIPDFFLFLGYNLPFPHNIQNTTHQHVPHLLCLSTTGNVPWPFWSHVKILAYKASTKHNPTIYYGGKGKEKGKGRGATQSKVRISTPILNVTLERAQGQPYPTEMPMNPVGDVMCLILQ